MAHFYGKLQGSRGEATRCGTKRSGVETHVAAWGGCIRAKVFQETMGGKEEDTATVAVEPWQGSGQRVPLYYGPVSGAFAVWGKDKGRDWLLLMTFKELPEAEVYASAFAVDGARAVIVPAGGFFRAY